MKHRYFEPWRLVRNWMSVFCFTLLSTYSFAQITGAGTACIGETETYASASPGSSTHNWSSTDGSFLTTIGNSATITWNTAGSQELTLEVISGIDTTHFLYDVFISSTPSPEISTINGANCSKEQSHGDDRKRCIAVCENTPTSFLTPIHAGNSYEWIITGATSSEVINDNEATITWTTVGPALIKVIETNDSTGCVGEHEICIEVIEKPIAGIESPQETSGSIQVCANQSVIVNDDSEGASSWFWDFGDGFNSSQENPPAHSYNSSGTYQISLVATNDCGCSDTTYIDVEVLTTPGPEIECASLHCGGDTTTYTTTAICATYNWDIENGSIILGVGSPSVTVVWDEIMDGPGLISLETPSCGGYCDLPSFLQIPVIPTTLTLENDTICQGSGKYQIPKYPSTSYVWEITAPNGTVTNYTHLTNELNFYFGQTGTYEIEVSIKNDVIDCEGTGSFSVIVLPQVAITGVKQFCEGLTTTLGISNAGVAANWSITTPDGTVLSSVQSGPQLNSYSFNDGSGTYLISAEITTPGITCNSVVTTTVTVFPIPPTPTISGDLEVCNSVIHQYLASGTVDYAYIKWEINGGSAINLAGNPIDVLWTAPVSISAHQIAFDGNCSSDTISINVSELTSIDISGTPSVCVNGVSTYSVPALPAGSIYEWEIVPASAGSISSGQGTETVEVQWLNSVTSATINLTIPTCSGLSDSYAVNITPAPAPVISGPATFCEGTPATLSSTGAISYQWYDNDGNTLGTGASQLANMEGNYSVISTYSPGCQGTSNHFIEELPSPTAGIYAHVATIVCETPFPAAGVLLESVAQAGNTYEWFNGASSVGTAVTYTAMSNGIYTCVVTSPNGCQNVSDPININIGLYPCSENCVTDGTWDLTVNSPVCNPVFVNFDESHPDVNFGSWDFNDPHNPFHSSSSASTSYTYSEAGVYVIGAVWTSDSCLIDTLFDVTIPLAANFEAVLGCTGTITQFNDLSSYLGGDAITTWNWDFDDPTPNGTTQNPTHTYSLPGTYSVTLTVSNSSCTTSITQDVIVQPITAGILPTPITACVGEAIPFQENSSSATPILSYLWNFGDATTSLLEDPSKSYDVSGTYLVSLTITNYEGCTSTITENVTILPTPIEGIIDGPSTICPNTSVTLTAPSPAASYSWSTGETGNSIVTNESGNYHVEVTLANGCSYNTAQHLVLVNSLPGFRISSNGTEFCEGDYVSLIAAPSNLALYDFQWYFNGTPISLVDIPSAQNAYLGFTGAIAHSGSYQVEITYFQFGDTCSALSDPIAITVNPRPTQPIIVNNSGSSCAGELHDFEVSNVEADITYVWSNGIVGNTMQTYDAGYYSVIATNQFGCSINSSGISISPLPPVECVLFGCYCFDTCSTAGVLPIEIPAPNLSGYNYEWYSIETGTFDLVDSDYLLQIYESGEYQVVMTSPIGCSDTSDVVDITFKPCEDCANTEVSYSPVADSTGDCCWNISATNGMSLPSHYFEIIGIDGITIAVSDVDPSWTVQSSTPTSVVLGYGGVADPIPTGILANLFELCLSNATSSTQEVVFNWYGEGAQPEILCSDTLQFHCDPQSDCVEIANDTTICKNDELFYGFQIQNNSDFIVESVVLNFTTPGIPQQILDIPSLSSGATSGWHYIALDAFGLIPGDLVCFTIVAHDDDNPEEAGNCCSDQTEHCFTVPEYCNPCEHLSASVQGDPFDCCWNISFDNAALIDFDAIQTSIITPGVQINSFTNPIGSGWNVASSNTTSISWMNASGASIPSTGTLPEICLDASNQETEIAVNWMIGDSIVCTDTVKVECNKDCIVKLKEKIGCDESGNVLYTFQVLNNGTFDIAQISLVDLSLPGVTATFVTGPANLAVGATGTYTFQIDGAAVDQELCFKLKASDNTGLELPEHCCITEMEYCVTIPDCCKPVIDVIGSDVICKGNSTKICVAKTCCKDYKIEWSTGATSECIEVFLPGTYTVKIFCKGKTYVASTTILAGISPTVVFADTTVCSSSGAIQLTGSPSGGTYSGSPFLSASGSFNSNLSGVGNFKVSYSYEDPITGCLGIATATVTVKKSPKCFITPSKGLVAGEAIIYTGLGPKCITLSAPFVPGHTYLWSDGSTGLSTSVCPTDNTSYTLTVTDADGCSSTCFIDVCVINIRCNNLKNGFYICQDGITRCVTKKEAKNLISQGLATPGPCGKIINCQFVSPIGIEQVSLKAFPNPTNGESRIIFTMTEDQDATVNVIDARGRVVELVFDGPIEGGKVYEFVVNTSNLEKGIYIVSLVGSREKGVNLKLTVQ